MINGSNYKYNNIPQNNQSHPEHCTEPRYGRSADGDKNEAYLSYVASSVIAQNVLNNQHSPTFSDSVPKWQNVQEQHFNRVTKGEKTSVIVQGSRWDRDKKHNVVDFSSQDPIPSPWEESKHGPPATSSVSEPSFSQSDSGDMERCKSLSPPSHSHGKRSSDDDSDVEEVEILDQRSSLIPLKKRQRMMELPYGREHGVNVHTLPIMPFTLEEEFKVIDYIVRIEDYQNKRFNFLASIFPLYKKVTMAHIACTKSGKKIPFNKHLEDKLFKMGLNFTTLHTKDIYDEMRSLPGDFVRREVLNSTYPALYIVMFSILEGNSGEKTWRDQHNKTLHITKENHAAVQSYTRGLENVRAVTLKDQERFTSPWAVELDDEIKFEQTIARVGQLLGDDLNLQALYHMLVMMTPSSKAPAFIKNDSVLLSVQKNLSHLIYRYLSSKTTQGTPSSPPVLQDSRQNKNPDTKTRLLIGLIEDVHDSADIMQNRSLLVQSGVDIGNFVEII